MKVIRRWERLAVVAFGVVVDAVAADVVVDAVAKGVIINYIYINIIITIITMNIIIIIIDIGPLGSLDDGHHGGWLAALVEDDATVGNLLVALAVGGVALGAADRAEALRGGKVVRKVVLAAELTHHA